MNQALSILTPKQKFRLFMVKFLQKTKLNQVAHHAYYRYVHSFDTASQELIPALQKSLEKLIESDLSKEGDYYEFGVFKGYAFWYAQHIAGRLGLRQMRFFGFDSFAGLPEITQIDQTQHNEFYKGQYSCSKQQVEKNLNQKGVDWEKTHLIEGFFSASLTNETKKTYGLNKVALALIDCDLYASTVEVLSFLNGMIADGTILIFDDWNCFNRDPHRGQRRAFREFLDSQPQWEAQPFFSYGLYGQVFVMRTHAPL